MAEELTPPHKPTDKELFLEQFDAAYTNNIEEVLRGDIGGLESIVGELDRFKRGIDHPFLYEIMGARPPKGFLLTGPPGTGKTHIAKYLAHHLDARFIDLPLTAFESKWVGEAEKNLTGHLQNFQNYYKVTGKSVLVFFDEAEEVFKSRGEQGWHGPRVNVLLRAMDGLGKSDGVIFGAATNHVDKVDSAILRPGRLDFIIKIPDYDATMLGDVYRAQRDYRNRKSLRGWGPFHVSLEECQVLGKRAYESKLTPADVAEVYRRAVEDKVTAIAAIPDDILDLDDKLYKVRSEDLERVMESYKSQGTKEKRRIGFR
jgi:SpoVK/Ycf46/Vps4 family AAA+-type ATPase